MSRIALDAHKGIKEKIRRAVVHFEELNGRVAEFLRDDPYETVPEYHDNRSLRMFRARNVKPIPDDLPLVVGDCIQNFRSALDYLACWLVEENGGSVSDGTGFPLWNSNRTKAGDPRPIEIRAKGGVSPEALALIEEVQPYNARKGRDRFGGELVWFRFLWLLNELARWERHRSLSTIVAVVRTGTTAWESRLTAPTVTFSSEPLKEGEVFAITRYVKAEAEHHSDPEFRPDVTFDERPPVGRENVVSVLGLIKYAIEDMVMPRFDPAFFLPRYFP